MDRKIEKLKVDDLKGSLSQPIDVKKLEMLLAVLANKINAVIDRQDSILKHINDAEQK